VIPGDKKMSSETFVSLSNAFADSVETAGKSTVMVNGRRRMPSTGIAYTSDLLITANHTIEREEDVKITLPDGSSVTASLAGRDPSRDIALLRLKEGNLNPPITSQKPARIGEMVLALGRPDDNGLQASLGVVSAIGGPVRTPTGGMLDKYLRSDTFPFPGFSGGPLISANGNIIGMNTSGLAMETLITIPVDVLWPAAQALATHGHIRRPYLGVRSQTVNLAGPQQEALGRKQDTGLLLVSLEENSPAASAGFIVGDILVGVNRQPVADHEALQIALNNVGTGPQIPIEVLRGGKPSIFQVTLGER
jgi:S1-C subfamily serine protease